MCLENFPVQLDSECLTCSRTTIIWGAQLQSNKILLSSVHPKKSQESFLLTTRKITPQDFIKVMVTTRKSLAKIELLGKAPAQNFLR